MTARLIRIQLHKVTHFPFDCLRRTSTSLHHHVVNSPLSRTSLSSCNWIIVNNRLLSTTSINERSSTIISSDHNPSKRTEFKNIPINKSILSYIQTIGVGIRPRRSTKKKKLSSMEKGRKSNNCNNYPNNNNNNNNNKDDVYRNRFSNNSGYTLSKHHEKAFFDQTLSRGKIRNKKIRSPPPSTPTSRLNNTEDEKTMTLKKESPHQMWLPPPPFSTSGLKNKFINEVKRLPVKIIGSVGSLDDEMPRSTKGLPEVAIIGRSNVGKSTLLNALLYGNQEIHNRTFIRGKTPDSTKLGKGTKAIVSSKPGETKRITFYQLTSQIFKQQQQGEGNGDDSSTACSSYKMSLVLADLPGYGFAYTSEEKANMWKELMNTFLVKRGQSLKRILLLIDARHGFKKADYDFLDTLQKLRRIDSFDHEDDELDGLQSRQQRRKKVTLPPIQVVLTKSDLVTQNDLARRVVQVRQQLSDALIRETSSLPVMLCSAKAGLGFNNVRGEIAKGGILEIQRELAALVPKKGNQ